MRVSNRIIPPSYYCKDRLLVWHFAAVSRDLDSPRANCVRRPPEPEFRLGVRGQRHKYQHLLILIKRCLLQHNRPQHTCDLCACGTLPPKGRSIIWSMCLNYTCLLTNRAWITISCIPYTYKHASVICVPRGQYPIAKLRIDILPSRDLVIVITTILIVTIVVLVLIVIILCSNDHNNIKHRVRQRTCRLGTTRAGSRWRGARSPTICWSRPWCARPYVIKQCDVPIRKDNRHPNYHIVSLSLGIRLRARYARESVDNNITCYTIIWYNTCNTYIYI